MVVSHGSTIDVVAVDAVILCCCCSSVAVVFVVQIASVCFPALLRLFSTFILAEGNYSRLIRSSILSAVVFIDIVLSLFLFKLVWMLPTDRSNDGEKCRCVRLVVWIGTSIVCS